MTDKDVSQIKINNRRIGIVGLESVIQTMAKDYAQKADEEVKAELIKRLSKKNYIPNRAVDKYGQAFVREFRKHLGQPFEEGETVSQTLEIKILGTGCARCDWIKKEVINALSEVNLAADVEHITDIREIAKYRVIGSPALVINGKTMSVGKVPSKEEIKKWLAPFLGQSLINKNEYQSKEN